LKLVEKESEDYGYAEFTSNIDVVILGRKTYDWTIKEIGFSPYDNGDKQKGICNNAHRKTELRKNNFLYRKLERIGATTKIRERKEYLLRRGRVNNKRGFKKRPDRRVYNFRYPNISRRRNKTF
jgi:hypothetical protein